MTTNIYDAAGACVRHSRNLRGMLRFAQGNGVRSIDVIETNVTFVGAAGHAYVRVHYASGHIAETYFASFSHAVEWATTRSKASPKTSWFAGCSVVLWKCLPGMWSIDTNPHNNVPYLIHTGRITRQA